MKSLQNLAILAFLSIGMIACGEKATQETTETESETAQTAQQNDVVQGELAQADFEIEGMACAMGCAAVIEKKLAGLEGVKEAKVDFETKKAEVIFDDAKQNEQSLRETVEKLAGGETYKVEQIQIQKVEEA